MNLAPRFARALRHHAWGACRRAFLRQSGQLNCNPLGIIGGLAVMIGTIEVWNHGREAGVWVLLVAAPAAIALLTLITVRLLQPMAIVSSPRRRQQSVQNQAAHEKPTPTGPPSRERQEHDPAAADTAKINKEDAKLAPHPAERCEEPELIKEPA